MLRHGDEIGHSQQGNNNAYCQDNEISWLDWDHADTSFARFCAGLVDFRLLHPVFRRRRFFEGRPIFGSELSDICWFRPDGEEMTPEDWNTGFAKSLAVFLNGDALPDPDRRGHRLCDDSFLLLFNAHFEDVMFMLPGGRWGERWLPDFDTAVVPAPPEAQPAGAKVVVAARDMRVLRRL
jgi:glycogen operon protein